MAYDISPSEEQRAQVDFDGPPHNAPDISLLLVEVLGMVLTAFVMSNVVGDDSPQEGDVAVMSGDNNSAVSSANMCGGTRDRRAAALISNLGTFRSGWCFPVHHIATIIWLTVFQGGHAR